MNRNVPTAVKRSAPVQRNVPAKTRPKVAFQPRFFRDAIIYITSRRPDLGNTLLMGEVLVTDAQVGNSVASLYMSKRTYDWITDPDDDFAIGAVQQAIEGARMGVKTKVVDASVLPGQSFNPVALVDRSADTVADKNKNRMGDLEQFVEQVGGLFLDLQGFDFTKMTDVDRTNLLVRYGKLRDRASGYRSLVAQMEGSFEVIQKAIMEMVNADG